MTNIPEQFHTLSQLFQDMDNAWDEVAARYKFQCTGCKDNCCLSLFFHHTHVEADFLRYGFSTLAAEKQKQIKADARIYLETTFPNGADTCHPPESKKMPCPLLADEKCGLYRFRPMICRMHGLPHELHKPGFEPIKGPGCDAGKFNNQTYIPFDRTPFYQRMAAVEMDYRTRAGISGKTKQTVAQILLDMKDDT